MMVASISTAAARPTPNSFMSRIGSVAKIENTLTITTAALVTVPAVVLIPCSTASAVVTAVVRLAHSAEDEHVVVDR